MECARTRPERWAWYSHGVVLLRYGWSRGAVLPVYHYTGSAGAFFCSITCTHHSGRGSCSGSPGACWLASGFSGVSVLRQEHSVWWGCRGRWIPCDSAGYRRQLVAPIFRNLCEIAIDLMGHHAAIYGETRAGNPGDRVLGQIPLSGRDQSCSYTEVVNQQGRIRIRQPHPGAWALVLQSQRSFWLRRTTTPAAGCSSRSRPPRREILSHIPPARSASRQ